MQILVKKHLKNRHDRFLYDTAYLLKENLRLKILICIGLKGSRLFRPLDWNYLILFSNINLIKNGKR